MSCVDHIGGKKDARRDHVWVFPSLPWDWSGSGLKMKGGEHRARILLALPRVLLLLLGGGKYNFRSNQALYFLLNFWWKNSTKKTSWPGREKYKCLSKKSLQQWRRAPKGKVQRFCWIGFSFRDRITPLRPSSMTQRGHISSVLCHACPTLIASSSDRCGYYFWRALRPIKPTLDSPYDTQVIGIWPSQWQISPSNYFRRMDVILCLTDYESSQ